MSKPPSEDLGKRIVAKRDEGHTTAEVSRMFGVSMRSVDRYCARMQTPGGLSHDKLGKPPGSRLDAHQVEISKWIAKEPGLTLEEIAARCEKQLGLSIHHTTVMRALGKWGFCYKKRYTPKSRIVLTLFSNASPDMNPIEMVFSKIKAYLRDNPSNCIERMHQKSSIIT